MKGFPMKRGFLICVCFVVGAFAQQKTPAERAEQLLQQMTLEEKIGQLAQVDYDALLGREDDIVKYSIGSILWGGSSDPPSITPQGWADAAEKISKYAERTRLKIPLLLGIDAVHGHNNVDGAVIFPHNIGLGATRNEALVERIGQITAAEVRGTGIQWTFAPCVAVARNERWGRTYESFGEDPALVGSLTAASVKGLQGKSLGDPTAVVACAKHYLSDGGTTDGKDQGNAEIDEATLRTLYLPGYIDAVKAGAKTVMASLSSWNGKKIHGHKYLLTDVLKNELGFKGFIVSDWAGIDQLPGTYKEEIEQSINAGLDMAMLPFGPPEVKNYVLFVSLLKELVNEGRVPMSRIDDAVRRILTVKFEVGLFEPAQRDQQLTAMVGSKEHREVARDAVRQSLVLLKNEGNLLPLSKTLKRIHVAGLGADSMGVQCGGWTILWQGRSSTVVAGGTTILQGIRNSVSKETAVTYSIDGDGAAGAAVGIVVVGEMPYAEGPGDRTDLSLSATDLATIKRVKSAGIPVVVVLLSGRPMLIDPALSASSAFVAAWLPGSEGEGLADVLFGDFKPAGKLPHSWPRSMKQIPINVGDKEYDPLFPYGFGLTYSK
jgi:beta-glucosidase